MGIVTEKGKLFIKGEVKTGQSASGNQWANQQIVVEVYGFNNSIKRVALQTNKTDILYAIEELPLGAEIEIKYSVSAREWNGKWYNNVELVSLDPIHVPAKNPKPVAAPAPVAVDAPKPGNASEEDIPEGDDGGMPF